MWYIAQAVGVAAMIFAFLSFQFNSKKMIIIFQAISSLLFATHYGLLTLTGEAALTGAILNLVNIAKCVVFCFALDGKKWASFKIWVPVFLAFNLISGILTWEAWYSILPVIGFIFPIIAYLPKKNRTVRMLYVPASPCWLVYNIMTGAWPALITECLNLISLSVAIIRFDILGQEEKSSGKSKRPDESADV